MLPLAPLTTKLPLCRVPGVLVDHYVVEPEQMAGTDNVFDPSISGAAAQIPRTYLACHLDLTK